MLKLRTGVKIYLSNDRIDLRKSIDGLAAIVYDHFASPPNIGNVFIFTNKLRDKVKLLFWDKNGFVLYYKRMEKGKFRINAKDTGNIEITEDQLHWLLAGLDFILAQEFPELNYY